MKPELQVTSIYSSSINKFIAYLHSRLSELNALNTKLMNSLSSINPNHWDRAQWTICFKLRFLIILIPFNEFDRCSQFNTFSLFSLFSQFSTFNHFEGSYLIYNSAISLIYISAFKVANLVVHVWFVSYQLTTSKRFRLDFRGRQSW